MKHLTALLIVILFSCNSVDKKSYEEKNNYFISVYTSLGDFKSHHKEFSDRCTAILNNILSDNFKTTDTLGLAILLNNAKTSQKINFETIFKLQEVDTTINLKSVCVDYLIEAKNYYDNYYDKFLSLAKTPKNADSVATLHGVSKEIKILMHKDSICIDAYKAFKEKYGIQGLN